MLLPFAFGLCREARATTGLLNAKGATSGTLAGSEFTDSVALGTFPSAESTGLAGARREIPFSEVVEAVGPPDSMDAAKEGLVEVPPELPEEVVGEPNKGAGKPWVIGAMGASVEVPRGAVGT